MTVEWQETYEIPARFYFLMPYHERSRHCLNDKPTYLLILTIAAKTIHYRILFGYTPFRNPLEALKRNQGRLRIFRTYFDQANFKKRCQFLIENQNKLDDLF